jgi:hypothetical protein
MRERCSTTSLVELIERKEAEGNQRADPRAKEVEAGPMTRQHAVQFKQFWPLVTSPFEYGVKGWALLT